MLRRRLSGRLQTPGVSLAQARDHVDEGSYGVAGGSRGARETKGSRDEEIWRIAAMRAVGSLSLVFFFAVVALWFFVFRGLAWQGLLSSSLGGFLGSWIAAVWGVEGATDCPRKRTAFPFRPEVAIGLARWGFFLGVFGFVAFFLIAYR